MEKVSQKGFCVLVYFGQKKYTKNTRKKINKYKKNFKLFNINGNGKQKL